MKRILSLGLSLLTTFFLFGQSSNSKIDIAKEKLEGKNFILPNQIKTETKKFIATKLISHTNHHEKNS
jgi:hypothetical protein